MAVQTFEDRIRQEFAPVKLSIVEFAESDAYCHKLLYPYQRVMMKLIFLEEMTGEEEDILSYWIKGGYKGEVIVSPMIRERRDWLREHGYKHFAQYQLVGGRSSSKGYLTGIVGARKVWETQQLRDPGRHYGIDSDKEIYFSCVAASLDQAKKYLFSDLASSITRCKALQPHLSKVMEEGINISTPSDADYIRMLRELDIKVGRDWSKLRAAPQAANADTIRGQRAIFLAFDEMAWMLPGESRSSAEECYSAAEPAMLPFGRDGLIALQSSPYTKLGRFFEEHEKAMEIDEYGQPAFPTMFSIQFPSWALFEERAEWMRPDQARITVSPNWPDSMLNEEEMARKEKERITEKANPEEYRVERRGQWAEAIDAYLDPMVVSRAFAPQWEEPPDGIIRPVKQTSGGTYMFTYAAHADPSSTTAGFGFAMGHAEVYPHPHFPQGVKHVFFDFVKRWNPEDFPEHTIDYFKVSDDIVQFINWYHPYEVTMDKHNSTQLIQSIRIGMLNQQQKLRGDQTKVYDEALTNAQLWERWEALKTALNLGLVHIPPDCVDSWYAEQELKLLQKKATEARVPRVEKQDLGPIQTKDIADCIREIVWKFIGQQMREFTQQTLAKTPLTSGAEGGYRIGGQGEGGPKNYSFEDFYSGKRSGMHGEHASRGFDPSFRGRRPPRRSY